MTSFDIFFPEDELESRAIQKPASDITHQPHIVGIDPGLSGAVAVYDRFEKKLAVAFDMPTFTTPEDGKRYIHPKELHSQLLPYALSTALCVIEDVGPRPDEGVVSVFRFGFVTGAAHGVVASLNIPIFKVRPQIWKSLMNLDHDKNKSRLMAIEKFHASADLFRRKKDDGRAEAALLAVFGERLIPK